MLGDAIASKKYFLQLKCAFEKWNDNPPFEISFGICPHPSQLLPALKHFCQNSPAEKEITRSSLWSQIQITPDTQSHWSISKSACKAWMLAPRGKRGCLPSEKQALPHPVKLTKPTGHSGAFPFLWRPQIMPLEEERVGKSLHLTLHIDCDYLLHL